MPFNPNSIAGLVHWAAGDGGVFQDAAKAVPCTDGTAVWTWQNNGSSAADFVQATGARQPIWNASGSNAMPYITFSTDWLTSAAVATNFPVTFFFVAHCTSVDSGAGVIIGNNGTTFQISFTGGDGTTPYIYAGSSTANTTKMPGFPQVMAVVFDNSSPFCSAWVGTSTTAVPNGTNIGGLTAVPVNLQLGGSSLGPYTFNGDFYEVLMYNSRLSSTDRNNVIAYLTAKYATFLGNALPSGTSDLPASYGPGTRVSGDSNDELIQTGVRRDDVEGDAAPPSMALDLPGRFRFRWGVEAGARTVKCRTKQVSNVTGKRPRLIVCANPAIGVNSDVIVDAGSSTGWLDLGPASVTPTSNGVLWVELWNMDTDTFMSPAWFDDITTT